MNISYNWLKQYINIDMASEKLSEILTNIGLEIGGIDKFQSIKGGLEGLVIGEVKTKEKHPDADKLSVTTVDVGGEELLDIVCGAPNVNAGQKVVVATVGTVLYDGDESFTIKKSKIRGMRSVGMICAEDELGLGKSHDGIMVLDADAKAGTPAKKYFNIEDDLIFEVDLTPNRIDAASHYGVARDLAAYFKQQGEVELTLPSVDDFKVDNNDHAIEVSVENTEACHRYSGVTISDVEVKESPEWLQLRLKSIGLTPINNIVDITNFVLFETGQPLHAFDANQIEGGKVIVKTLPEKTKFTTLDDVERELSANDLMICNEKEGMCIAGVFGGTKSGVTEKTQNIFLESAYFDSVFVRKTAKRHTLSTDASFRFERGTDPNGTLYALKRAALLIKEIAGGTISSDIVDIYPEPVKDTTIEISYFNVNRLIGKELGKETIKNILTALEIKIIAEKDAGLVIDIPPYRVDVKREADVIEDILRIYGYNNIEMAEKVNSTLSYSPKPDKEKINNTIADLLSNNGFNEIMNNSLTKESYYEKCPAFNVDDVVHIFNPLSIDLNVMRQTLLFGGLEVIAYNSNRRNSDLKLYEFGNCYYKNNESQSENPLKKYTQDSHLGLFITGKKNEVNWNLKEEPTSFFTLKAYVENILKRLGFNIDTIASEEISNDILAEGLSYTINKKVLVDFGIVNREATNAFDIEADVYYADLNWDNIITQLKKHKIVYKEIAKYPDVKRDLALLLDKNITFKQIKDLAYKTEKKLLRKVSMFDFFEGEKLGADKKSYAVSFILQDETKTLTDKQIDKIMKKLIFVYEKELGAQIR